MDPKPKVVLLYSGGLDSTVLLYHLLADNFSVYCLTFDYGQRHLREIMAASKVCLAAGVAAHKLFSLADLTGLLGGRALFSSGSDIPEGCEEADMVKATVVPHRNAIFLSIASAWAVQLGAKHVVYGAVARSNYPDCQPAFVDAIVKAMETSYPGSPTLIAPFLYVEKERVCRLGASLKVPFELTWTCYRGGERPCGKCGACLGRAEAFEAAGITDPVVSL